MRSLVLGMAGLCLLLANAGALEFEALTVDELLVDNELEGFGEELLFSTYAGRAPLAGAISSQDPPDPFLNGYETVAGDDFTVPPGVLAWHLRTINVNGTYWNATEDIIGNARAVSVHILPADAAPFDALAFAEAAIYSAEDIAYRDSGSGDFTIPLPDEGVYLRPGQYWLIVQAEMAWAEGGQWAWTESSAAADTGLTVGAESVWSQTAPLLTEACSAISGSRIADCGLTLDDTTSPEGDLCFALLGKSITEAYSIAPGSPLVTSEFAGEDAFSVALSAPPTHAVELTISSSDTSEALVRTAGGAPSLVLDVQFTPEDWDVPQHFAVLGQNDALADGHVSYTIDFTAAVSSDPLFAASQAPAIPATNLDNETPAVLISKTGGLVLEEGGSGDAFLVYLSSPPSAEVTIPLTASDADVQVQPQVSFATGEMGPVWVFVGGLQNERAGTETPFVIETGAPVSLDAVYGSMSAADIPDVDGVLRDDGDLAGIIVTLPVEEDIVTLEAGGAAPFFTFALSAAPSDRLTIDFYSTDLTEGIPNTPAIAFTPANWADPQTVQVLGQDDDLNDGDRSYALVTSAPQTADASFGDVAAAPVPVLNVDDEGVADRDPGMNISGVVEASQGDPVVYSILVRDAGFGTPQPFGVVRLFLGNTLEAVAQLDENSEATLIFQSPPLGLYEVDFQYDGDTYYEPLRRSRSLQVRAPLVTVTTLADEDDGEEGGISLRDALNSVHSDGTIVFGGGLSGTINLDANLGPLLVQQSVTIEGPGPDLLTIQGNNTHQLFFVHNDTAFPHTVHISGFSMRDGMGEIGGAIRNTENLTVEDCHFSSCVGNLGGAIASAGDLMVENCTFDTNVATNRGGAVYISGQSSTVIRDSGFFENEADFAGGAIAQSGETSRVSLYESSIVGNSSRSGGAIEAEVLSVISSTISENTAIERGGGIYLLPAEVESHLVHATVVQNVVTQGTGGGIHLFQAANCRITNSLIAGNIGDEAFPDDVFGNISSSESNLYGVITGMAVESARDLTLAELGSPPLFEVYLGLVTPAGRLPYHPLASDSHAINTGDATLSIDPATQTPLSFEQRGAGFPRVVAGEADIGAVEAPEEALGMHVYALLAPGQPLLTLEPPVHFELVFTSPPQGLTVGNIQNAGDLTGVEWELSGSGTRYDLTLTAVEGDGTVFPHLPAGVVTDGSGQANTASVALDEPVRVDRTSPVPEVLFGQDDPTSRPTIFVNVQFNEAVQPVVDEQLITIENATLVDSAFPSATVLFLRVSPAMDGLVEVNVGAGAVLDLVGNPSEEAFGSIRFDATAPVAEWVAVSSPQFNIGPAVAELRFNEPVFGLSAESVFAQNAAVQLLQADVDGLVYRYGLDPIAEGPVSIFYLGGNADAAGNAASEVGPLAFTYDTTAPETELHSTIETEATNQSPIPFVLTYSEAVISFNPNSIILTNATLAGDPVVVDEAGTVHFSATPIADGPVSARALTGNAQDLAGNPALESATVSLEFEGTAPTVVLEQAPEQPDPVQTLPVLFDVQFSEPVLGFQNFKIKQNGTATGLVFALTQLSETAYRVEVVGAQRDGTLVLTIEAGAVTDAVGNGNIRSISEDNSVLLDRQAPTIQLSGPEPVILTCGEPFAEPGVTVTDNVDGDISDQVEVEGNILPLVEGTYELTYRASDLTGNVAEPRTRTVKVVLDAGCGPIHSTDTNEDGLIELSELLRIVQLFNAEAYHCAVGSPDGYEVGPGDEQCRPHNADYRPQDWQISLRELLRIIQMYSLGGYFRCDEAGTEDGFCVPSL